MRSRLIFHNSPDSPGEFPSQQAALRIDRGPPAYVALFLPARPPPELAILCDRGVWAAERGPSLRTQPNETYYPGGARSGLRRFRQRMTCGDLAGRALLSRFDPFRLRFEHDRKDFIGPIGARTALRALNGDERKPMDVSEDDIRGLRRFGGSSRSLSDLVDAEEASRHLGITPRRVLSMARKPFAATREE